MSTGTIKVEKAVAPERTEAQAARAAPVSLPAGSFDADALAADLDKAAMAKNDKTRPELVDKAVEAHNKIATEAGDGLAPGYKRVVVEDENAGVTENRIVFDPALAEKAAAAQSGKDEPAAPAVESE